MSAESPFDEAMLIQRQMLAALQSIEAQLTRGASPRAGAERDDLVLRIDSVEVEDNSRGTVAKAKAYGATMQQAEDEAIASIQRIRARLSTMGQLQAAAADLAAALVGLLIAVQDHIQDFSDGPGDFPKEPIANAYQALAKAGVETT